MTNVIPLVATGPPPIDIKDDDLNDFESATQYSSHNGEILDEEYTKQSEKLPDLDSDNKDLDYDREIKLSYDNEISAPPIVLSEYLDKVIDGTVNEPICDALSSGKLKVFLEDNVDGQDGSDRFSDPESENMESNYTEYDNVKSVQSETIEVSSFSKCDSLSNTTSNSQSTDELTVKVNCSDSSMSRTTLSEEDSAVGVIPSIHSSGNKLPVDEISEQIDQIKLCSNTSDYCLNEVETSSRGNIHPEMEPELDNFTDFSSASTNITKSDQLNVQETKVFHCDNDNCDDEFANFSSRPNDDGEVIPNKDNITTNSDDEFADFSSRPNDDGEVIPNKDNTTTNSDDEFADFSARPYESSSVVPAVSDVWSTKCSKLNESSTQQEYSFVANFNKKTDEDSDAGSPSDDDNPKFGKRLSQSYDIDQFPEDGSKLEFKKPIETFSDDDDDDFNDFENAVTSAPGKDTDDYYDDDEFDEFTSVDAGSSSCQAAPSSKSFQSAPTQSTESSHLSAQTGGLLNRLLSKLEPLLERSFTEYELDTEKVSGHIRDDAEVSCDPQSQEISAHNFMRSLLEDVNKKKSSPKIWYELGDWDQSIAMSYQWNNSKGYDIFLKSLGIDYRNVLVSNKPGLPSFASQLGLLEPVKPDLSSSSNFDRLPSTGDVPSAEASTGSDSSSSTTIPPPQFDWSSSGLTNPLDSSNNTVYLDLDFFENLCSGGHSDSLTCASPRATRELEAELLSDNGLPSSESVVSSKPDSVLQRILLKNSASVSLNYSTNLEGAGSVETSNTDNERQQSNNPEVNQLLDKLPDFSFMHARVLMFPVRTVDTDAD